MTHDLGLGPDLMLILGTSLKVHGLKVLVRQFAKAVHSRGGKVVFVNFTRPPESSWGDVIDYWVAWDCDAWVGDLREKVPALWLPPGVVEEKRRGGVKREKKGERGTEKGAEKGAEKKNGEKPGEQKGGAKKSVVGEKKKSTVNAKRNTSKNDAAATTLEPSVRTFEEASTTATETHTELATHRQLQAPEPQQPRQSQDGQSRSQRRVVLREDKVNGAYFTWKIMESLRGISGRVAPPPMELPTVATSRAIAAAETKEAKREWKRKRRSAVAAERAGERADERGVLPGAGPRVQMQMPEVWSIHSSAPGVYGPVRNSAAAEQNALPPGHALAEQSRAVVSTERGRLPVEASHPSTSTRGGSFEGQFAPSTPVPSRRDPSERKHAHPQPFMLAELRPTEQSPTQQPPAAPPQASSILTAVKSNPRKRKRKTINGEEVVLPAVGSRKSGASPSDKENTGCREKAGCRGGASGGEGTGARGRVPSISAQPLDGAVQLPPLRGFALGGWKLDAMEPVSPPEGPVTRFEGRRGSRGGYAGGYGNPFFYEDALVGLGTGGTLGGREGRAGGGVVKEVTGREEREMEAARTLFGMR